MCGVAGDAMELWNVHWRFWPVRDMWRVLRRCAANVEV